MSFPGYGLGLISEGYAGGLKEGSSQDHAVLRDSILRIEYAPINPLIKAVERCEVRRSEPEA